MAALLALAGFMGSGKTSVGRSVAAELGWRFVDLDERFVEVEGHPISDVFASTGEAAFREREAEILREVVGTAPMEEALVVALGGGTLESPNSAALLRERAEVVLLDVDAVEAWSRVAGSGRPLARDEASFGALLARRKDIYESAADWIIPVTGRTEQEVSRDVLAVVRLVGPGEHKFWGRRLTRTDRSSVIVGGVGALDVLPRAVTSARAGGSRLFVITDENVMAVWGSEVGGRLGDIGREVVLVVEPGEQSKSVSVLARCWEWLAEVGARRDDIVVALGGGVVGDLAGFAAATYQRGVGLWQVPTTLLAQVDSSVGGKTAVDLNAGKNLVGAFYQPDLVVMDPLTLGTLGKEEYASGLGEVIKHCLLMGPKSLSWLEERAQLVCDRDPATLARLVRESVDYKAKVVEKDEKESGVRAVLNLGHTAAHALEVTEGYGSMSHGQAVGLGLLVALAVSEEVLGLDPSVQERTRALLTRFGLATTIVLPPVDQLMRATARDKKVRARTAGFVGLRALGEPTWGLDVPAETLGSALEVIRQ